MTEAAMSADQREADAAWADRFAAGLPPNEHRGVVLRLAHYAREEPPPPPTEAEVGAAARQISSDHPERWMVEARSVLLAFLSGRNGG